MMAGSSVKGEGAPGRPFLLWFSLGLFLACYLGIALVDALRIPLWMDEILSVWAARLPTPERIYSALQHGSEMAPPLFPLLLHYCIHLFGDSRLSVRLMSLAATVVTGLCTFILIRRHSSPAAAAFGFCLVLEALRVYALEARPYALVAACFALALVCWDRLEDGPVLRSIAIFALLALANSLHFYAVLLIPCLGLIEIIYETWNRRLRATVWVALTAAGASIFVWWPLIHTLSRLNAADSRSPDFYAKPSLQNLSSAYATVFLWGKYNVLLLLAATLLIGTGAFFSPETDDSDFAQEFRGRPDKYWAIVLGLVGFPLIVFAFSRFVTGTFNDRYMLASVVGTTMLITGSLRTTAFFRRFAPLLVFVASGITLGHYYQTPKPVDSPEVATLPGQDPIVVADGREWFPLVETAPSAQRRRIVYLTLPPTTAIGDPTNEHQIERWKTIDPSLSVDNITEFLQHHRAFYVVDMRESDDTQLQYLLQLRRLDLVGISDNSVVFHSGS